MYLEKLYSGSMSQREINKNDILDSSLQDKKIALFSYWDSLPIILEMDASNFKKIAQEARHYIIKILSFGIEDEYPTTGEKVNRHVLSASEINDLLAEKYEVKIKKSNLYFHLSALEECGCIRVVEQIPTGKRFTTYYGRTAKVFYPKGQSDDLEEKVNSMSPLRQPEVRELIIKMNPDVDVKEIEANIKIADGINQYDPGLFKKWVNAFSEHTEGLDINFVQFHGFLSILNRYDLKTVKGLIKIAEYLGFDKLEKSE